MPRDPLPSKEEAQRCIETIVLQAMENYSSHHGEEADPRAMKRTALMSVAALGEHCALDDEWYYNMWDFIDAMPPRKRAKWHSKLDDGSGTNRRVYYADGMMRMANRQGAVVPIVPVSISTYVASSGDDDTLDALLRAYDSAMKRPSPCDAKRDLDTALHSLPLPDIGNLPRRPKGRPPLRRAAAAS